jgi:hypothetical protein
LTDEYLLPREGGDDATTTGHVVSPDETPGTERDRSE